jgi:hypothetical protein
MTYKLAAFIFLFGLSLTVFGQTEAPKKMSRRPDIPGAFALEFGFNQDLSAPDEFDLGFWGSRTANLYYQYDVRIAKSKFSFVPGIGLSLERYKFTNDYTLAYPDGDFESIVMIPTTDAGIEGIKKSQLITNYVEVPLELKFSTKPDDPARSFKISVGGRFGYMFDSFTKLKYKEEGEVKKLKNKEDFNLNKIRYGLSGRIGIGGFSFFCYYNLTPLFEEEKGLSDIISSENSVKNDFNTITIGISLASF